MASTKQRVNPLISILVMVLSVGMVVIGFVKLNNRKTYLPTDAVITRIDEELVIKADDNTTEHTVYVKYSVDGKEYETQLGYYDSSMKQGDNIQVLYNPENPEKIQEAKMSGVYVMFGMGAVSFLVGAYLLAFRRF